MLRIALFKSRRLRLQRFFYSRFLFVQGGRLFLLLCIKTDKGLRFLPGLIEFCLGGHQFVDGLG